MTEINSSSKESRDILGYTAGDTEDSKLFSWRKSLDKSEVNKSKKSPMIEEMFPQVSVSSKFHFIFFYLKKVMGTGVKGKLLRLYFA